MRILVVGGTGFLGSELASRLKSEGNTVRSLNTKISSTLDIEQTLGDISNPDSYLEMLSTWKPEVVVQCAWITEQINYRNSPLNDLYAKSTVLLAKNCFLSGTEHFLVLGSCAEYGDPKGPCDASTTKTQALDAYGVAKLWTLEQLKLLATVHERKMSWARIFQPYGRNQDPARLIPTATEKLKAGEKITISNPGTLLDWITSRDVASAISYILANELPQVIDVGTSIGTSILGVLTRISELVGADSRLIETWKSGDEDRHSPDLVVSKESPLLADGWTPQDDLTSGLTWALSL